MPHNAINHLFGEHFVVAEVFLFFTLHLGRPASSVEPCTGFSVSLVVGCHVGGVPFWPRVRRLVDFLNGRICRLFRSAPEHDCQQYLLPFLSLVDWLDFTCRKTC